MFYIVRTGGKQYIARPGQVFTIEKIPQAPGETVNLEVLATIDGETTETPTVNLGTPTCSQAVQAVVKGQGKGKKVITVKYKRKIRYRRRKNHRQQFSTVMI